MILIVSLPDTLAQARAIESLSDTNAWRQAQLASLEIGMCLDG